MQAHLWYHAPPVYTVDAGAGQTHNLHNLLNHWEFLGYGLLAVLLAALVSCPEGPKGQGGGLCRPVTRRGCRPSSPPRPTARPLP